VWIFSMRIIMIVASALSYFVNGAIAKAKYENAAKMNFEAPLTSLVWLTSVVSVVLTYALSRLLIPELGGDTSLWWKLSTVITCGTLAGAIIPEFVKVFTSTSSRHVREVVTASREGGASLNILSGFVDSSNTDCALSVTGPYESTAIVTGPMPRKPNATRPKANTAGAIMMPAGKKLLTS